MRRWRNVDKNLGPTNEIVEIRVLMTTLGVYKKNEVGELEWFQVQDCMPQAVVTHWKPNEKPPTHD